MLLDEMALSASSVYDPRPLRLYIIMEAIIVNIAIGINFVNFGGI